MTNEETKLAIMNDHIDNLYNRVEALEEVLKQHGIKVPPQNTTLPKDYTGLVG